MFTSDKAKAGFGIAGILAAGAAAGIGIKAGVQKAVKVIKDKKAKKAAEKAEEK